MEALVEKLHQKLRLAFAHEALIDEHAGELVANRLVQQKGEGGGINASRESQQHPLIADLGAHISHRFVNESCCGPIGLTTTNVVNEIAQHCHAAGGVHHLRMELHAV